MVGRLGGGYISPLAVQGFGKDKESDEAGIAVLDEIGVRAFGRDQAMGRERRYEGKRGLCS